VSHDERCSQYRTPITLRVDYSRRNAFIRDYARNISTGGTFVETPHPLPIGTEFMFQMTLPGHPEQLALRGEVRWIVTPEQATVDQPAGMGVRFLFDSDEAREQLERTVEALMRETLGDALTERLLTKSKGG
jgi:type IV pilus assembly protein PilZ